jgi:hypothetical protein
MSENTQKLGEGFHYDIPASIYHADPCETPSLSSGCARTLIAKSPAHAALEHPKLGGEKRESSDAMNTGTLIHAILNGSDEIVVGFFSDFKTNVAKEWRNSCEASGKIPVLEKKYAEAKKVAESIRQRAALGVSNSPFNSVHAKHEVTAIWKEKGCFCRARYDVLNVDPNGYADIWDWKTTTDISDHGIQKKISGLGYHIQAAFYLRGLETLLPKYRGRTSFIFVFAEINPPYAVRRVVLRPSYYQKAGADVNQAINLWAHCIETNTFPMTAPDTLEIELPAYMEDQDDEITID